MGLIIGEDNLVTLDGKKVVDEQGTELTLKSVVYALLVTDDKQSTPEQRYELAKLAKKVIDEKELNVTEVALIIEKAKKHVHISFMINVIELLEK